jgi:hypothetical protein
MLKYYCHSCGGWAVACHTTSPQKMILPPIKRSRILASGGVVIVISVKFYNKSVDATLVAARTLPENSRLPASSDQRQKVALCVS